MTTTIIPPPKPHSEIRVVLRTTLHDAVDFLVDADRHDLSTAQVLEFNAALSSLIRIASPYRRDTEPCLMACEEVAS